MYRKWGEPYPSTKRLYLPPYTTFTATSAISLFPLLDTDSEMSLKDTEDTESDTETEMSLEDTENEELDTESDEETPEFQINETKTYVQNTETKEIFETPEQFLANIQAQIPKTHPEAPEYKFAKKVYWKLETASLVLVERNRHWFEAAKPRLQEAWEAIEQARQQLPPPQPILSTAPSQTITKTEKDIKHFFLPLS
jgi:hypothetical protein